MKPKREQIAGILEIITNSRVGNFYIISPAQMLLLTTIIKELTDENERLRERNVVLEQKLIIFGCDEQYFFKAKEKENEQ